MLGFIPANRTIKVFRKLPPDSFGHSAEDTDGTDYQCYFSMNTKFEKVRNNLGNEVVFTASMLFNQSENIEIAVGDRVEFSDDFGNSKTKTVIAVNYKRDFGGQIMAVKVVI